jgi:hypothetical protein
MAKKTTEAVEVEVSKAPEAPEPVTLTPKELEAIHMLRGAVLNVASNMLRQGDPARAILMEQLLAYQVNVREALRP